MIIKTICLASLIAALSSIPAAAQIIDELSKDSHDNLRAGFNVTMPFGPNKKLADPSRFALTLSFDHDVKVRETGSLSYRQVNLMELGLSRDGRPDFYLSGQDLSQPLFGPLYAGSEKGRKASKKTKSDDGEGLGTALLILSGVSTLGLVVFVNETADDIKDCGFIFPTRTDDPKCD